MARERQPADWIHDLQAGRDAEDYVRALLFEHPAVSRIADLSNQPETPDFEFRFEGERVGLEVKSKLQAYSSDYRELWPELAERDLFILDESSLRALSWAEGMGYLLIADVPSNRWVVIGPWELLLGPRRRFERLGQRTTTTFTKGKLLLDLRMGETMDDAVIEDVLRIVRRTRATRREVRPIRLHGQPDLPVVPKSPAPVGVERTRPSPSMDGEAHPVIEPAAPVASPVGLKPEIPAAVELSEIWCGLSTSLAGELETASGWMEPTEVQRAAIPSVLAGHNTLVLAPTAGGKTEAALLPLLDVARREGWRPTSILAVSPMKALLDDQLRRYQSLAPADRRDCVRLARRHEQDPQRREFLGIRATSCSRRRRASRSCFTGGRQGTLSGIRAVIVDEVHAFVGTARGAQLAALLERLDQRCEADLQRVGLSATVGTPDERRSIWLAWQLVLAAGRWLKLPGAATRAEETNIVSY